MKAVLRRIGGLVSLRVLALGLTFLQTVALSRVFGAEVFGQLSVAVSVGALLLFATPLGLDQVLMRSVAQRDPTSSAPPDGWAELRWLAFLCMAPLAFGLALIGVYGFGWVGWGGVYATGLTAMALGLPFLVARRFTAGVAQGLKRPELSILGPQVVYPLAMIAGAGAVWASGAANALSNAAILYFSAIVLSFLVPFLLLRRSIGEILTTARTAPATVPPSYAAHLRGGAYFAAIGVGAVLNEHMGVLLTGALASPEDVAIVRVASRLAGLLLILRAVAALHFKPIIAAAYAHEGQAAVQRQVDLMARIITFVGLPAAALLWVFAEQALWLFGDDFAGGVWPVRVYLIGFMVMIIFGAADSVLTMGGREGLASRIVWIGIAVAFALNLALIPSYGALGCAIASMASMIVIALGGAVAARRALGVRTSLVG